MKQEWKEALWEDVCAYGADILEAKEYRLLDGFIQHGTVTCREHCICVALCSLALARKLSIRCDEKALVRGALLHDYFLYDWHERSRWHTLHGFSHARTALRNADRDFELNKIEKDIIRKHMWPLNPALPTRREAWVVTMADKYCSGAETLAQIPIVQWLT